jgi:hypothetical protein
VLLLAGWRRADRRPGAEATPQAALPPALWGAPPAPRIDGATPIELFGAPALRIDWQRAPSGSEAPVRGVLLVGERAGTRMQIALSADGERDLERELATLLGRPAR